LIGDVRWGRLVRGKCKLEVVNDAIDYGEIGEESDDPHHAAALRADHRINFIDFTDHLGPAAVQVAAVEVALDDFFDDRPEEAVLLLEAALVLRQEPVEVMKKHPVEDGPLRMPGTIHSRHSGRMASRNGPRPRKFPYRPGKRGRGPDRRAG